MKRCVFFLAIAAVLAVPAGASAFFRCWCAPRFSYGYGAGYGYGYGRFAGFSPYFYPAYPAYPYFPAPYSVTPIPTAPQAPLTAPRAAPKAEAPVAPPRAPIVTITPGEPTRPTTTPRAEVEPVLGTAPPSAAPAPVNEVRIPDPMVPKSPAPIAIPAPAPSSDAVPPIGLPDFKKTPNGKDDLPPIVLPPEVQGKPSSGVIPPTTSRSSPLTGAVKVQVFTAMGQTQGDLRQVGFFNHTSRDIDLVIAGKAVKLPKKSYLNARLPVKFVWKQADGIAETAVVPAGAAGLDVLFKE